MFATNKLFAKSVGQPQLHPYRDLTRGVECFEFMASLLSDVGKTVLRVTAICLLIFVGGRVLVKLNLLLWAKLDYVPYLVGAYIAIEMLIFAAKKSSGGIRD